MSFELDDRRLAQPSFHVERHFVAVADVFDRFAVEGAFANRDRRWPAPLTEVDGKEQVPRPAGPSIERRRTARD